MIAPARKAGEIVTTHTRDDEALGPVVAVRRATPRRSRRRCPHGTVAPDAEGGPRLR